MRKYIPLVFHGLLGALIGTVIALTVLSRTGRLSPATNHTSVDVTLSAATSIDKKTEGAEPCAEKHDLVFCESQAVAFLSYYKGYPVEDVLPYFARLPSSERTSLRCAKDVCCLGIDKRADGTIINKAADKKLYDEASKGTDTIFYIITPIGYSFYQHLGKK